MDTITALATPPGIGGIAVIRLSGNSAIEIADSCFHGKIKLSDAKTHTIHYGKFLNDELLIDTVTLSVFKTPNSYTGEDVVEISCHGGYLISDEIINILINRGARLADAGEFTKRAFLNGKLDLAQVEAVADIIHSKSIPGTQTSARQIAGNFTKRLNEFRNKLLNICSMLELELDFADEDLEFIDRTEIEKGIIESIEYCNELSGSFKSSEILRSGFFVGIAGYPNSGKSTLFNSLLQRKRAIVSEQPGTTRDYLEDNLMLGGITIKLIDTAGLRKSKDYIEIEGIKMVESVLKQSNMIIVLNDISISPNHSDNLIKEIKNKYSETYSILVQNKIDLIEILTDNPQSELNISAKRDTNLNDLKKLIESKALESSARISDILVNQRQATLLNKAANNLAEALTALQSGAENELISIDIRQAAKSLGEITGKTWNEEVLNNIFANFCIGK